MDKWRSYTWVKRRNKMKTFIMMEVKLHWGETRMKKPLKADMWDAATPEQKAVAAAVWLQVQESPRSAESWAPRGQMSGHPHLSGLEGSRQTSAASVPPAAHICLSRTRQLRLEKLTILSGKTNSCISPSRLCKDESAWGTFPSFCCHHLSICASQKCIFGTFLSAAKHFWILKVWNFHLVDKIFTKFNV